MRFRILGPVEALGPDGRPLAVRGQPLRLLGLLLVRRGEPVAPESAIDALWGETLPANPANALQLVVSRLRRVLGRDAVAHDAAGYSLAVAELDAERFETLAGDGEAALARGDPAAAAELLHAALELWRGPALHGVGYESYAAAEVARLEERRLACLGARIDADLALGRAERVLDELSGLVVEHPLRTSFARQRVRALLASGRGAEALAATREASPAAAVRRARREVVCVAVDLRAPAALDLELRSALMGFCADEAEAVLRRHGEPVVARVPDGLIAVFGARRTHEDEGLRAVRAATAVQRRLGETELDVRVGVTAGTALVTERDALPTGEVVAAAARLARGAPAGELALSGPVRALVGGVRGREAPLAGRERELEALARAPAHGLMLLLGEAGIGKSRLVRELAARAPARVLIGRCPAYGDGVTYWPLREIVQQARGGRPLEALLAPTEEGRAAAAAVAATLGLGGSGPAEALPWAFRTLFAALAPVVLVLEDAHWAEPPLLDLVEAIVPTVRWAAPAGSAAPQPQARDHPLGEPRLLVLCAGRPELLAARPGWAGAPSVRLEPLDDEASRRLLAGQLPEPLLERVVAQARGNPLFLEQLAAHVAERGDDGALPPALHALLSARLDALGAERRRLLEAAAVEGETFHVGALGAGAEAGLEELVRGELLLPARPVIAGQRAFRFRHALVRDAAYAAMPLAARAAAHEALADWLAEQGDAVPEASARIGAQLERAHAAAAELRQPAEPLAERAAARLVQAARDVHRRGDLPSEVAFLERALALRGGPELLPALGAALFEAGSLDRAAEVADAAAQAAPERVRRRGEVERERLRAYRRPEQIDPAAALAVAEGAAAALDRLGDTVGVARARYLMCELLWMQGRSERAIANAREVVRIGKLAGDAVELDAGVSYVAWALVVNRVPVESALAECEALLGEVAGRRFAELGLRGFIAVLDALAGRFAAARAQLARSRAGLHDLGLHEASIWMAMFDATAEQLAGEPAAAAAALDEAERVAVEIGDRWFLSTVLVERAHVVLAQGGAAEAAVARIEDVPAPADAEWLIKRHAARGKLAARAGDAAAALHEARAAVALADATDLFLFRADAWRDLAEVAGRCGERDEAERARATALALYTEKGATAAARRLMP